MLQPSACTANVSTIPTFCSRMSVKEHPLSMAPQSASARAKKLYVKGGNKGGEGRSSILRKKSPLVGEEKSPLVGEGKSPLVGEGKHGSRQHQGRGLRSKVPPGPGNSSVLWNAMVYPFLNMTIYGVIWYEGGADALKKNYNCTFPAMIEDWRGSWYNSTNMKTEKLFPFGFVQVSVRRGCG